MLSPQRRHIQTLQFGQCQFAPVILFPHSVQDFVRQSFDIPLQTPMSQAEGIKGFEATATKEAEREG